jgi:hypothetical protein
MGKQKYAAMFRDARVQSLAESLFPEDKLNLLMVSKILVAAPGDADQAAVARQTIAKAEADLVRAKQMLALCDMAAALNGGSYDRIIQWRDD